MGRPSHCRKSRRPCPRSAHRQRVRDACRVCSPIFPAICWSREIVFRCYLGEVIRRHEDAAMSCPFQRTTMHNPLKMVTSSRTFSRGRALAPTAFPCLLLIGNHPQGRSGAVFRHGDSKRKPIAKKRFGEATRAAAVFNHAHQEAPGDPAPSWAARREIGRNRAIEKYDSCESL